MTEKDVSIFRSKAEHVAHRLLERIIDARLKPGASFATEAELLSQFNVSRPTLRESLRMLESQGVLAVKPGPGGGIIVGAPSIDLLAHGLSVFLRLHEVPFITVIKAREVIEPALAREAALHATEDDLAALAQSISRMKALLADADQEAFIAENLVFHRIITQASGNKVLEAFWSTITVLEAGQLRDIRFSVGNQAHVAEAHERILAACRARDGDAAAAAMHQHVSGLESLVRTHYQHMLTDPTAVVARPGRALGQNT
jgi:DNA-binding FadR family transcriptional regulator